MGCHFLIQVCQVFVAAGLSAFKKRSNLKQVQFAFNKTELDVCWKRVAAGIQNIWPSLGQVLGQSDELLDLCRQQTPAGRLVTPEDVADVVLLISSDLYKMVVGQTLVVDGGFGLQRLNLAT